MANALPSSVSSSSSSIPSTDPPPGTYPLETGDRVTAIKTLEVIQRQCHIVASNGATVRQYAASNGDIVVILEEISILDNIKYQARVRFIGSGHLIRQHIPSTKDKASSSSALGLAYTSTNNHSPSFPSPSLTPHALSSSSSSSVAPLSPTAVTAVSSSSSAPSSFTPKSPKSSSSSSSVPSISKTRRTIYEIEDDLNLNFITEIVRIYPDGRTERVKTWPFAPDGRCIIQALPNFPGRGWGLDALPFVHQWIFRSDESIMRYDGTDLLLNRLHQQIAAQRYAANATCTALRMVQQQQDENRQRIIAAAHCLVTSRSAKEAAPHVPNFLRLLTQADINTLVNIRMYILHQTQRSKDAGSAEAGEADEEEDDDENDDNLYANAASSTARLRNRNASSSRKNPFIPSFIKKKVRRPNVIWRYNLFPIPIPVSTFVSLGRFPDQPYKFYDHMVESAVWHWLNLDKEPPPEPSALDIQQQHEAKKDKSMEKQLRKLNLEEKTKNTADDSSSTVPRRSKIAVIRTMHIPYPIPVTHAVIVNPAIQRFVDKRTYVTDLSSLSNTANCRREGGELPPLWRGHMHWQVQIRNDNGNVEVCGPPYDGLGMNTKLESSTEDVSNLLGQHYPLCNPSYPPTGPQILYRVGKDTVIPRSARVHFHTSAAPFASQEHVDALVELRNQSLQENIPVCPKPWIEDEIWIPPDSAIDTATVTALAAAIYPILTKDVNLKDILPSALDLPLQEKEPEPEPQEGTDENPSTTTTTTPHTTNDAKGPKENKNNANETSRSSSSSSSSGSGASSSLSVNSNKSSSSKGLSSTVLSSSGKPKYVIPPIPEPRRWYFIDEVGAFSSTLWYQRLISSSDPFWFFKPPVTVGYRLDTSLPQAHHERAVIIREGIYESVRRFTYLTNGSSNGLPPSSTAVTGTNNGSTSSNTITLHHPRSPKHSSPSRTTIDGPYLLRGYDEQIMIPVIEGLIGPAQRPVSPHSLRFTGNYDGHETEDV